MHRISAPIGETFYDLWQVNAGSIDLVPILCWHGRDSGMHGE